MRIYADSNNYEYELDRFVGRDIWVLVQYKCNSTAYLAWIRIVDSTETDYVVNEIKFCYFDEDEYDIPYAYTGGDVLKNQLLSDTLLYRKANTNIVEPLEVASTEDLFRGAE
jgi:hypothetical protein